MTDLNIDVSQKEGELLDYDPVQDFGAISSYDTEVWINKGKKSETVLRPVEIRSSDEEENNPVASIVDGSPDTKWSVKGRDAWILINFGRPILLERVKIDFHMKKNEKRLYKFGIFAVTAEVQEGQFEYTSIADNLSNDQLKTKTIDVKNYIETAVSGGNSKIQTTSSSKLLFWFTNTSSKRKRFSIIDIQVEGYNLNDILVEEPQDQPVGEPTELNAESVVESNNIIEQNDDVDTFGATGIINLPGYTVTKERTDFTKNFQPNSFRWDFEGDKPAKSIIVGGLFQINSNAADDISWKTEGGIHSDKTKEVEKCGRCNDVGLSYDGKQVRYRVEKFHHGGAGYTANLEVTNVNLGDLRKKWIGVQEVSQLVKVKESPDASPIDARRIRVYVDPDAKKADGTLNNNYQQVAEFLNIGQYKDDGETVPIVHESQCDESQTTIRLDNLKENEIKYEGLFLRNIEDDDGIDTTTPPPDTKLPPKVIVKPQEDVTTKGQKIIIDASKSEDPDGTIVCYIFKQTGQWFTEQRLGLRALSGNDLGKCEVTYPTLNTRPKQPLTLAVTVVDNDKLSKTLPVVFLDKIDYGGGTTIPPVDHGCKDNEEWNESLQKCVEKVVTPPPQPTGTFDYEAAIHGKWKGNKRLVTDADPECPKPFVGGKGLEMHASGSPQLDIQGDGTAILTCKPGHGRFYIDTINYNSILWCGIKFLDINAQNSTCQLRSRHQEGGAGPNRFGGISYKVSLNEGVGLKMELYHNVHSNSIEKKLAKPLEVNKEYQIKLTCKDTPNRDGIFQSIEIDYGDGNGYIEVISQTIKNPPTYAMDRPTFEKRSYLWLRMNNDTKNASIKFTNPRVQLLP